MSSSSRSLVRHQEKPEIVLTKPQALLLAEALRRGEEARDRMEDPLIDYGRWLLVNVFENDAAKALDPKSKNAVWVSLLRRAGGPTLRISRRILYVTLEIAARDKRINDDVWRNLEPGRKELLLPLASETAMRKAARRVVTLKMSQSATRKYVASLRDAAGKPVSSRVTPSRLLARLHKFRSTLAETQLEHHANKLLEAASDEQRAAMRSELDEIANWVLGFAQRLG
jgi:hypothetical protein